MWQHIGSYIQSLPPTPVRTLTKGNAYLGKNLLKAYPARDTSSTIFREDPTKLLETNINADSSLDNSDRFSYRDQSYSDLIHEYTSKNENLLDIESETSTYIESNSSINNSSINVSDSLVELDVGRHTDIVNLNEAFDALNVDQAANYNAAKECFDGNFPTSDTLTNCFKFDNQTEIIISNNPAQDLITHNSSFNYTWKMFDDLPTQDLVKNAQRLLESVSETLIQSESIANNLERKEVTIKDYVLKEEDIEIVRSRLSIFDNGSAGDCIPGSVRHQMRDDNSKVCQSVTDANVLLSQGDILIDGHNLEQDRGRERGDSSAVKPRRITEKRHSSTRRLSAQPSDRLCFSSDVRIY